MKKILLGLLLLAAAGAGGAWWWNHREAGGPSFRKAKVERGDLQVTVTATGTVEPITQVQVGTQVTGTIQKLFADFNSRVKAGEVVAQIDPAPFQAKVDQDRANLLRAKADVERVKAGLLQAEKELARTRELARRELMSASDLDAAVAAYDSLAAQLKVAEATVRQAESALRISEVNLGYTTIVSPIDGLVISRNVDVGQTVAASLQAPTLFVIADNLRRIQVKASVAEADIGRIAPGMEVTFTVDAWRERPFVGKVSQIRLSPTTVQNVVTYTVVIDADNPEEKLLPGMTANVTFLVERHEGVLKVPNAALRFTPPEELQEGKGEGEAGAGTSAAEDRGREGRGRGGRRGRVWVPAPGGKLKAVSVVPGATDGAFTQILRGDLQEGQEVVTGIVAVEAEGAGITNPFAPPRPPRMRRGP